MRLRTLETILRALESANVQYLVAGGVAVNAYGYQRLTQDLDLVIGLERENVERALDALSGLGYRPMVPVGIEEFADPEKRKEWIEHKNMQVFSLASDTYADTTVDIFAREPFDFEVERAAAEIHDLALHAALPLVRLSTLIAMKQEANRPRDQDDVQHLRWIADERVRTDSVNSTADWSAATWEGSRRAQIQRSLHLTVRERLEALEALTETSERLAHIVSDLPTEAVASRRASPD